MLTLIFTYSYLLFLLHNANNRYLDVKWQYILIYSEIEYIHLWKCNRFTIKRKLKYTEVGRDPLIPFNHIQFCGLLARIKHFDITRYLRSRCLSRFFDRWAHETMCAYLGNKQFFTKLCRCQTYQNYKISWQKSANFWLKVNLLCQKLSKSFHFFH